MSWVKPLEPTEFTALAEKKINGKPFGMVTYKGITYKNIDECRKIFGFSRSWMRKLVQAERKRAK